MAGGSDVTFKAKNHSFSSPLRAKGGSLLENHHGRFDSSSNVIETCAHLA